MIQTSRMNAGTITCGQIIYDSPIASVSGPGYKLLNKSKLIAYAESIGIDVPKKATMNQIYILIENKEEN